jgi:hypothetical protein
MTTQELLSNILSAENLELLLATSSTNAVLNLEDHSVSINYTYNKQELKTKVSEIFDTLNNYIEENTKEDMNDSNNTAIDMAKYLKREFDLLNSMLAL